MRKTLTLLLLAFFLIAVIPAVSAAADIKVIINDIEKSFTPEPVIKNGKTLVPMRGFFEALGCEVSWNPADMTAVGKRGSTEIKLPIGKKTAYINGMPKTLSVQAQLINNSTYIPLRFVGEALGETVLWDGATRTITITTKAGSFKNTSEKDMYVHFLDVGQGDAILIQSPSQAVMLIDAGPRTAGEKIVAYLKKAGISVIDKFIATHPHADHIGGAQAIFNNFKIKTVYDSGYPHTSKTYENFLTTIDRKDIGYTIAHRGNSIALDDEISVNILHPGTTMSDANNNSIVLKVTYGNIDLIFTGDAEKEAEEIILENNNNLDAEILKVGHHGSSTSTSTEFLKAVSPEVAVIMVGADNSYGHPHAETLAKLANAGVKVYRTDKAGDIVVTTNGNTYSVNAQPIQPVPLQEQYQETKQEGKYVGSIKSDKYHIPTCRYAEKIYPENKIWFKNKEEAHQHGYIPCGVCKP